MEIGGFTAQLSSFSDSNHAPEFKFPLITTNWSQHEFSVRQSLYCFRNNNEDHFGGIETFVEAFDALMKLIYLYRLRSLRVDPEKRNTRRAWACSGWDVARSGKVNKRPLKFIITGFIMLKLLGARWLWKKWKFNRNGLSKNALTNDISVGSWRGREARMLRNV